MYECNKCFKSFKYKHLLDRHLTRKISCEPQKNKENYIDKLNDINNKIQDFDIKTLTSVTNTNNKCYYCECTYSTKYSLKSHLNKICKIKKQLIEDKIKYENMININNDENNEKNNEENNEENNEDNNNEDILNAKSDKNNKFDKIIDVDQIDTNIFKFDLDNITENSNLEIAEIKKLIDALNGKHKFDFSVFDRIGKNNTVTEKYTTEETIKTKNGTKKIITNTTNSSQNIDIVVDNNITFDGEKYVNNFVIRSIKYR